MRYPNLLPLSLVVPRGQFLALVLIQRVLRLCRLLLIGIAYLDYFWLLHNFCFVFPCFVLVLLGHSLFNSVVALQCFPNAHYLCFS